MKNFIILFLTGIMFTICSCGNSQDSNLEEATIDSTEVTEITEIVIDTVLSEAVTETDSVDVI